MGGLERCSQFTPRAVSRAKRILCLNEISSGQGKTAQLFRWAPRQDESQIAVRKAVYTVAVVKQIEHGSAGHELGDHDQLSLLGLQAHAHQQQYLLPASNR